MCGSGTTAASGDAERGNGRLPQAAELVAELLDVLGVEIDRFLIRLQALLHAGVVSLVALANALLFRELLLSVGEQLLLVLELRLEYLAPVLVAIDEGGGLAGALRHLGRH